jgi:hypothetical protein
MYLNENCAICIIMLPICELKQGRIKEHKRDTEFAEVAGRLTGGDRIRNMKSNFKISRTSSLFYNYFIILYLTK